MAKRVTSPYVVKLIAAAILAGRDPYAVGLRRGVGWSAISRIAAVVRKSDEYRRAAAPLRVLYVVPSPARQDAAVAAASLATPPTQPVAQRPRLPPSTFIAPPTRAQLMGRR